MKKAIIVLGFISLLSCKNQKLDLSSININEMASVYLNKIKVVKAEVQKGFWKFEPNNMGGNLTLIDNGEISTSYTFLLSSEEEQINYLKYKLKPGSGGVIVENRNKIVFYRFEFEWKNTFEVLKNIKVKLGKPSGIIIDSIPADIKSVQILQKYLPKDEYWFKKNEFGEKMFYYPIHYIWLVDNCIFHYTLIKTTDLIANQLIFITIDAYKRQLIFGYHNPSKDPILSKYLNKDH